MSYPAGASQCERFFHWQEIELDFLVLIPGKRHVRNRVLNEEKVTLIALNCGIRLN